MAAGSRRSCVLDLPDGAALDADLTIPAGARGLVVFAHGSGSSRRSVRNVAVAELLNARGLATLLMDLLTPAEDERDRTTRQHRFDIALLSHRVTSTLDWIDSQDVLRGLPVGCFGASTGAAAALVAAAERPDLVAAVVSRGGRPDLAGAALDSVRAPTLLLVGGADSGVMELNAEAAERLATVELRIVPGAGHLFDEPGALDQVQQAAADWFARWLTPSPPTADHTTARRRP
jgi:putative phosphoribosyl transferase